MNAAQADAETDLLHRLFRCERYVHLFGDAMPLKACLRRQLERIPTSDAKGRPESASEWAQKNPFCAASCELGRQHLEQARALKVPAETCLRCGGAQVGAGSAAPCASCPPDETQVPRTGLRAAERPAPSLRIWSGEVPDVPIGAPNPRQTASLEQMRRQAAEREEAHRAREEPMAKGVPKEPRTCCDSKGGRHKADCTGEAKEAAEVRAPRRAAARVARRAEPAGELELLTLEDLVEQRSQAIAVQARVEEELRRRQAAITAALGEE